jgi:hypothetical protein
VTPCVSVDVGVNVSEGSAASLLPLEPSLFHTVSSPSVRHALIHSPRSLSYDKFIANSSANSPHSAI